MNEQMAEKFATKLASRATEVKVAGVNSELRNLIKQAAGEQAANSTAFKDVVTNPLFYGPLIGTAAGGLAGYHGTRDDDKKKKKRNAMYGALTGGLGGLGIPLFLAAGNAGANLASDSKTPEQRQQEQQADAVAAANIEEGFAHGGNPTVRDAFYGTSRVGAGYAGWRLGGPAFRGLERILPPNILRSGELRRFLSPTASGKPSALGREWLGHTTPASETQRLKQYGPSIGKLRGVLKAGPKRKSNPSGVGADDLIAAAPKKQDESWAAFATDWANSQRKPFRLHPTSGKPMFTNTTDHAAAWAEYQAKLPEIRRANVAARKAQIERVKRVAEGDKILAGLRSSFPGRNTFGFRTATRNRRAAILHELMGSPKGGPGAILTSAADLPQTKRQRLANYGTRGLAAYLLQRELTPERANWLQNALYSLYRPESSLPPAAAEPAIK